MKKILLCMLLLALVLATPGLAAQVVGPDGVVRAVPDALRDESPAQLSAVTEGFVVDGVIYTVMGQKAQVAGYTADIPQDCVIPASVSIGGEDYPVTALADNALYNCSRLTSITLPETVTRLGRKSLSGCTGLTEVTISASVTEIDNDALKDCPDLAVITVAPDNAGGYHGDGRCLIDQQDCLVQYAPASGASYTVPEGTTSIGYGAFYGAKELQSVTLPDTVTRLKNAAFSHCENLNQIDLGQGLTHIEDYAFWMCGLTRMDLPAGIVQISGAPFQFCPIEEYTVAGDGAGNFYAVDGVLFCRSYQGYMARGSHALVVYPAGSSRTSYAIPNGIECLGEHAFADAESLSGITFPDSLTHIDTSALCGTGLISVTLPDSVTELGSYVFQTSGKLARVTLGSGTTKLPRGLFHNCKALEEVTIPATVTELQEDTFEECFGLKAIHVAEDNPAYQDIDGALYSKDGAHLFLCPAGVEAVTVPAQVTAIDPGAFKGCSKVAAFAVEPGNSVFSVQDGVLFQQGNGAITLHTYPVGKPDLVYTVPTWATRIGDRAFNNNPALTKLDTANVTEIGEWAVYETPELKEIVMPKVEKLGYGSLWGLRGPAIEFPATLRELGQQALDYNDSVEYVTFAGDVPRVSIGFMQDGEKLRYVYVPEDKLLASKDTLADANLKAGVMIVAGKYVPQATVEEQIAALGEDSALAEVNAAAAGVVRMLTAEKKALATALLIKADQLFQARHAGLSVKVDQTAVTDAALTVQGLALASGLVERQDSTGAVSGSVKLTATQETPKADDELLVLDFALSVNNAAAQPQSPVVVSLELPQAMRQAVFHLIHRDGKGESQVPYERAGDRITFRADSFSSYIFKAGEVKLRVSYEADAAATLFVAGYRDGQLLSIRGLPVAAGTGAAELDYDSTLTYKAFVIDSRLAPVGTAQVALS